MRTFGVLLSVRVGGGPKVGGPGRRSTRGGAGGRRMVSRGGGMPGGGPGGISGRPGGGPGGNLEKKIKSS